MTRAHSDVVEDSSVLGCDAMLLGERFLTFQKTAVPFSSGLYGPGRILVGPNDRED